MTLKTIENKEHTDKHRLILSFVTMIKDYVSLVEQGFVIDDDILEKIKELVILLDQKGYYKPNEGIKNCDKL